MSEDWANKITNQLLSRGWIRGGVWLILGGVDTGKTTLATALAKRLIQDQSVGIIDADVGQSHIGPPTTVGWAIADKSQVDFARLVPGGISFVGDVTPVGHLLQLTAAITQCLRQLSKIAELIIIDTPGFIAGPAASALWWTVQRIIRPDVILVVQQEDELHEILRGMENLGSQIELLKSPPQIPAKSPETRRRYRHSQFRRYFASSCLYNLKLSDLTIQTTRSLSNSVLFGRVVGLRDAEGVDQAIGIIEQYWEDTDAISVRASQLDIRSIRCVVVGDVTVHLTNE